MNLFTVALAVVLVSSCSNVQYRKADVLQQNNEISELKNGLDMADAGELPALSPDHIARAKKKLEEAITVAQRGGTGVDIGRRLALEGLLQLQEAEKVGELAREILTPTLEARKGAIKAYAHELLASEFQSADKSLARAGYLVETDKLTGARELNVQLQREYAKLELEALKKDLNNYAKIAYEEAVKENAAAYAPLTMERAKKELELAQKIVEVEKRDFKSAQPHARAARSLSQQATAIAHLVADMKKANPTREEMVLWYQQQLAEIHKPFSTSIDFTQENAKVVESFRNEIADLVEQNETLHEKISVNKKKISHIKNSTSKAPPVVNENAKVLQNSEDFQYVSTLFNRNEADVILMGEDIIIRAFGFDFPVGKADILPHNFPLLAKIGNAVKRFPNSAIVVGGHTDSTGTQAINLPLSKKRAENIASHLVVILGIDADRVSSIGFSDSVPYAKNDNVFDRSKNRRIEITIKAPYKK